jgi:tetratricopeptide (TPR) repeat protein
MSAPGRNNPCPCGSGKRYKDCHGALRPLDAGVSTQQDVRAKLEQALATQQAGKLTEAIAQYESAVAAAPRDFDARHMLGVARFQHGDFERAATDIDVALSILPGQPAARFNRELVREAIARRGVQAEIERLTLARAPRPRRASPSAVEDAPVRVIAFYLPQFHRIPENDAWWGAGFTEWTNVRKARPNFAAHEQPRLPGELGYYDLRDPSVRAAQAALARQFGIDGFCYYYYWFGGRRILDEPLSAMLASGEPDLPFCICWANENWTRRWDGLDHEILLAQTYASGDPQAFIRDLYPLFHDRRYIRIDGRPLVAVYKASDIPGAAATVRTWRDTCRADGEGELYLAAVARNVVDDPTELGFDAAIEFPPIGHGAENITAQVDVVNPEFRGMVFDYRNLAADYLMRPRPAFRQFRGVMPAWDNTPRRQDDGTAFIHSTPATFQYWLEQALCQTRLRAPGDERLVFVNAWNEWAEGSYLEPDSRFGRQYLESVREARAIATDTAHDAPSMSDVARELEALTASGAIRVTRTATNRDLAPGAASVVMPVYNHARFLPRTLASLSHQTLPPGELVAVDDGSSDDSVAIIEGFARNAPFPVTLVRQQNSGADVALNRGMVLARGDIVSLLNSDDSYMPMRLERMVAALGRDVELAFSDVALVDDDDRPVDNEVALRLRRLLDAAASSPELIYPLIDHNIATSTGNLVLRRELLERIGGFAPLKACHDWDFVLRATLAARVRFIAEKLYAYRLHPGNTIAGLTLAGRLESEVLLQRFFDGIDDYPFADDDARIRFLAHARAIGLGGYLVTPSSARLASTVQ